MLTIEITGNGAEYLRGLIERVEDLRPALLEVGEELTESTKKRFGTATAPDGTPWAPNSAVTLMRYGSMFARNKNGTLKAAGVRAMGSKKPLTGETRALQTTINYQVTGKTTVSIGSPMVYANVQQFGARAGEFGERVPWGAIPARPFLGVSEADRQNILDIVRGYLLG
jgi:phage virion morphogenesis protein